MMNKIVYSKEKMKKLCDKVQTMIGIVSELEKEFPGRHFTLDGHLVGSIGEVMAAYYYGIELYRASVPKHDGIVNNRQVQIKITQKDNIVINDEPDYLIVMYLTKEGNVYEVYNGKGKRPWETASKKDNHNNKHMRVNKLMELDKEVPDCDRIQQQIPLKKMAEKKLETPGP